MSARLVGIVLGSGLGSGAERDRFIWGGANHDCACWACWEVGFEGKGGVT